MKQGVLLVAHGAPERVEDVEEYLGYVRGGRPGSPEVLAEVRSRYIAIGGGSPLLRWTRAQAAALERLLGLPVFFGMRNWRPFLREAMDRVREAGIDKLAAVCLAPQFSDLSVGLYIRRTREAATEAGLTAEIVWAKSYHAEPLLIESYAERLRPLLPAERMLFTAHSLPQQALAADDPYEAECRATAAGVASSAGIAQWDFAFQSQGLSGGQWLGPTVESCLDRYAAAGVREVVLCPVGFVADHVEVLFDIDILFREYAAARGIELRRPESLNDSATFTAALAEVAKQCL
ncbi:MAG: ferrochelatase [Bryobacteraceae bacterium]|jgi:ferrochelatase